MTVHVRPFKLNDYDEVYRLWEASGPGIGLGRSDTRDEIVKKLERDPDLFLVAEDDNRIVGTVIGGFDGRRGIIYHLAVAREYRRRGLGTRLMRNVEQSLHKKGCLRFYLLVKPEADDIVQFYVHQGWEKMPVHILAKNIG